MSDKLESRKALSSILAERPEVDAMRVLHASYIAPRPFVAFLAANTRLNVDSPIRSVPSRLGQKGTVNVTTGKVVSESVGTSGASKKVSLARKAKGDDWLAILLDNAFPSEAALCAAVLYERDNMASKLADTFPDVSDALDKYFAALSSLAGALYSVDLDALDKKAKAQAHRGKDVSAKAKSAAQAARETYLSLMGKPSPKQAADDNMASWTSVSGIGPATAKRLLAAGHTRNDMLTVWQAGGDDELRRYVNEIVTGGQVKAIIENFQAGN